MNKIDLKKTWKHLYSPSAQVVAKVDVPPMNYLLIDGRGDPNTAAEYAAAVEALFSLAYALKFHLKRALEVDYVVMPLEGLWWAEDMHQFSVERKSDWLWTMMILQPEEVTAAMFAQVLAEVIKKKQLDALAGVRLEHYHEGPSAQIMHLGPYSTEGPTVAKLHGFIADNGYTLGGKHHEIYLSDPRKSAPEKMRTVIRQPFQA